MEYVKWLDMQSEFVFVSDKGQKIRIEITTIGDVKDKSDNPIEGCGSFFIACVDRRYDYKMISIDTIYYSDFMILSKGTSNYSSIYVNFEGTLAQLNNKSFNINDDKLFKQKINDLAIFNVNHHNYNYFENEAKQLTQIFWSKQHGLLRYQTKDSTVWTRLDYIK